MYLSDLLVMIIRDIEMLLVASTGRYRFRLVMRVAKFADRLKTKAIQSVIK